MPFTAAARLKKRFYQPDIVKQAFVLAGRRIP
jgi:hypothetical protein